MALKDIEKLKEKVDKDPNSKLFVPLAEEYRKEGMIDEAVAVLKSGIEKQPGYMSARVSLGKIYLDRGLMNEARFEFESVIRAIPDNLYAHKKLADIYRASGERELALKSYQTVLKLNAMDEEAINSLREMEQEAEPSAVEEIPAAAEAAADEISFADIEAEPSAVEEISTEMPEVAEDMFAAGLPEEEDFLKTSASEDEELSAFKNSLFGEPEEEAFSLGEVDNEPEETFGLPEEAAKPEEEAFSFGVVENELEETLGLPEEAAEPAEEMSFGDLNSVFGEAPTSFKDIAGASDETFEAADAEEAEEVLEAAEAFEVEDAAEMDFSGIGAPEPVEAPATIIMPEARPEPVKPTAPADRLSSADHFVAEGNYARAMQIYKGMLAASPGDRMILQRVEELRLLLKIMGKDKEALIGGLNNFLEGVNKRRDEFFRNT